MNEASTFASFIQCRLGYYLSLLSSQSSILWFTVWIILITSSSSTFNIVVIHSYQNRRPRAANMDILPWTKLTDLLKLRTSEHPSNENRSEAFQESNIFASTAGFTAPSGSFLAAGDAQSMCGISQRALRAGCVLQSLNFWANIPLRSQTAKRMKLSFQMPWLPTLSIRLRDGGPWSASSDFSFSNVTSPFQVRNSKQDSVPMTIPTSSAVAH